MTRDMAKFDMSRAPLRIGTVTLKVRDLESVVRFYQDVIGLGVIEKTSRQAVLGTGENPLIVLQSDPSLRQRDPRQPGLFHTAFLLPERADLGAWLHRIIESRVPLQGASDHIVSEAVYLADPEGNGIEVYVDRPVAQWAAAPGSIRMSTDPMDTAGVLQAGQAHEWAGFPQDGIIGHVHLQVGNTREADSFYRDVLGFDIATDYLGARFYGSGGYHHQLAGNIWNSRGSGKRDQGMAGLAAVEIVPGQSDLKAEIASRAQDAGLSVDDKAKGLTIDDPWGTQFLLRQA